MAHCEFNPCVLFKPLRVCIILFENFYYIFRRIYKRPISLITLSSLKWLFVMGTSQYSDASLVQKTTSPKDKQSDLSSLISPNITRRVHTFKRLVRK